MGMYCKQCQYDLSRCTTKACPECGRFFAPDVPRTYLTRPYSCLTRVRMPFRIAAIVTAVCLLGNWFYSYGPLPVFSASITYPDTISLSRLQTIRSQFELYANQHNGAYPTLTQLQNRWGVLTSKTDIHGSIGSGQAHLFGPYMQQPPVNAFTKSHSVAGPGKAKPTDGWEYDPAKQTLRMVVPSISLFNYYNLDPSDAVVPTPPPSR